MTILVELDPATEARLTAAADAHGLQVQEYAGALIREGLRAYTTGTGKLTPESLDKMLTAIAKGSEKLPKLPTSAFSRESLYEDHL
jgi:hypothetical protein